MAKPSPELTARSLWARAGKEPLTSPSYGHYGEEQAALDREAAVAIERLLVERDGIRRHLDLCEQIAGKALGYPWYKDDQKNFPGATEVDGVCIGEHFGDTIVAELANAYCDAHAAGRAAERRDVVEWLRRVISDLKLSGTSAAQRDTGNLQRAYFDEASRLAAILRRVEAGEHEKRAPSPPASLLNADQSRPEFPANARVAQAKSRRT